MSVFFGLGRTLYKNGEKTFYEEKFYLADSTVFKMFDYQFLHGDINTALDKPNSIVLTEAMAKKYFDKVDAVGLSFQNQQGDV